MDGNQRYSWTKKKRSPLVSRTLPRLFRCNTISCCRSVAISASSRAPLIYGETKMARTNQRSPITRSAYAIRSPSQRDEVFGTHNRGSIAQVLFAFSAKTPPKRTEMRLPIYTSGITDPHVASLSMPIFGSEGRFLGALALSGPSSRLTAERADTLAPRLLQAADRLSSELGAQL
jgi:hypothetical protein